MRKKHAPGCRCCAGPATAITCAPCDIPAADLMLSWYYWQVHYGGTYGTTYTPAGPITTPLRYVTPPLANQGSGRWDSGWIALPHDASTCNAPPIGATNDCCYAYFTLTCSHAGGTVLSISLSSNPDGSRGAAYCYDGTEVARPGPATYHCDPFMIEYAGTGFVGHLFANGVVTPSS